MAESYIDEWIKPILLEHIRHETEIRTWVYALKHHFLTWECKTCKKIIVDYELT